METPTFTVVAVSGEITLEVAPQAHEDASFAFVYRRKRRQSMSTLALNAVLDVVPLAERNAFEDWLGDARKQLEEQIQERTVAFLRDPASADNTLHHLGLRLRNINALERELNATPFDTAQAA